jgi:probable addiction module antidote protein
MTDKLVLKKWDSASHLKTTADMVAYLDACLQENDPVLISHALGIIAKAKGNSQVSQNLSFDSSLKFETVSNACQALGVRLHVEPV